MRLKRALGLFAMLAIAGCTSTSQRTNVSVGYYDVKGTSFSQLDQQIALHGPNVEGVGRAVASTRIKMLPDIRFQTRAGKCYIALSRIKVKADVTLPRLRDRNKAAKELRPAFSNIEEYARLHEAVHVRIADQFAARAEREIANLPPEETCETLQANAVSTFETTMAKHRAAQLKFDADEKKRFAKRS